jgi:serine O-acetyltransferase
VDHISADVPDWTREVAQQFWDPGRKLLLTIRHYQSWRMRSGVMATLFLRIVVLRHRLWSVVTGAEIPLNCQTGGGLPIAHPNGIVIHPDAKIGVNCLIFQQVTIGTRDSSGAPSIGGHVDIGAGAKVLGGIEVNPIQELAQMPPWLKTSREARQQLVDAPSSPHSRVVIVGVPQ